MEKGTEAQRGQVGLVGYCWWGGHGDLLDHGGVQAVQPAVESHALQARAGSESAIPSGLLGRGRWAGQAAGT